MRCFEERPVDVLNETVTQEDIDAVLRRAVSEHHDRNKIIRSMQYLVDTGKWHGNFILPAIME